MKIVIISEKQMLRVKPGELLHVYELMNVILIFIKLIEKN